MSFGVSRAVEFESDHLTIDDRTGKAILTGDVIVWNDTGTLKARRVVIYYHSQGDTVTSYEAFGQVQVDYSDIDARANYAYRDVQADTMLLQENAYVKRNQDEFWADRIVVNMKTSRVNLSGSVRGHIRQRRKSGAKNS